MSIRLSVAFAAGAAAVLCLSAVMRPTPQDPEDMRRMMEKAKAFTQPGDKHKLLNRFLGKWNTESRLFAAGQPTPPEKGTSEGTWLMDGRWVQLRGSASMMGMKYDVHTVLGYDNFKQSYVSTSVNTMDTAMLRAEGDLTQDGKTLITYGTLDEYLTGEHDKMVRYVWRFVSDEQFVLEVHDLSIGETNTKVVEITYTRA
ncbi:MAG: DUF1579 family protein [Planctomycetes bacterium]|nr:DUF1579 family protein [Planctomycetota bacterium]